MTKTDDTQPKQPIIPNWRLALYLCLFSVGCWVIGYSTDENPWSFTGFGVTLLIVSIISVVIYVTATNIPVVNKSFRMLIKILTWVMAAVMPFWLYSIIMRAIEKSF
jgi:hypothetical protein